MAVRLVAAFLVFALSVSGCVFKQRREMLAARSAYQECVEENARDAERKCAALEAESITRSERYESDARRAWGCGGSVGSCDPRERPGIPH